MTEFPDAFQFIGYERYEKMSTWEMGNAWKKDPTSTEWNVFFFDWNDERARTSASASMYRSAESAPTYPMAVILTHPRQTIALPYAMPTLIVHTRAELVLSRLPFYYLGKLLTGLGGSKTLSKLRVHDLRCALGECGVLCIAMGQGNGGRRVEQATRMAIDALSVAGCNIANVHGVVALIKGHPDDLRLIDSAHVESHLRAILGDNINVLLVSAHMEKSKNSEIELVLFVCEPASAQPPPESLGTDE